VSATEIKKGKNARFVYYDSHPVRIVDRANGSVVMFSSPDRIAAGGFRPTSNPLHVFDKI